MLIRDLFKKQVSKTPYAAAIVFHEKELNWRDIDSLSNRLSHGLLKLGLKKGDRVATLLGNSPEFLFTYLALLKNGGIFVPLNHQLKKSNIKYALSHSESSIIICDDEFIPTIEALLPDLPNLKKIITVSKKRFNNGIFALEEVLSMGEDVEPSIPLTDDDLALFLYTAGTTGDPKGVIHTHFNCGFVVQHWAGVFHMEPGKSVMMPLPLFHVIALHCLSTSALISGARIILGERYRTQWALEVIDKYKINIISLVPAMAGLIINNEDLHKYDLSSLEIMIIGGAIVPFEILNKWRKTFPNLEIINGFGQTESCPCCTGKWDIDILEKPRSVGKPWDVVKLKILDDKGKELSAGETGELVYKAPSAMKEYYKAPDLTAETLRDGWIYSGDLGYVDEDGYVFIVDRKKDIIIRGGENISSAEVEEILHQHPAVLDVAVIGAPNEVMGETVTAVVVKKKGDELKEDELIEFCKERLEKFKVPEDVKFLDELPRNPGGKVLKRELKLKYFGKVNK